MLGLVVRRNTRPRASSIAIGTQTLAAPAVRQPSSQLAAPCRAASDPLIVADRGAQDDQVADHGGRREREP